jgi:HEAT repeat protein
MKDKRFVIAEIVRDLIEKTAGKSEKTRALKFFSAGSRICRIKSDNAKEIGVHVAWRAYGYKKESVEKILLKVGDDSNWEVREYAAGAFAGVIASYPEFYKTLVKWRKHKSENVRRAVVMSAWGLRNRKDKRSPEKAFALLEPLMYDASRYVKVNLGPFVIGTGYGNAFPEETFSQLKKWMKIKDENVRWNIAMVFNNSFGNKYPEKALEFLRVLLKDESKSVIRAAISTLRTLRKRHPATIDSFLSKQSIALK